MNFWANKIQQQQAPAPPAAPAPAPPSNQPWWAPKAAPVVPQQGTAQPVPVQPTQQAVDLSAVTNENGQVPIGVLLHNDGYVYSSDKAQGQRDQTRCPECDSGNYIKPKGDRRATHRCFDCGYNEMFTQSAAGASATGQNNVAAPRPARVQTMATNNFNPGNDGNVVGRVS